MPGVPSPCARLSALPHPTLIGTYSPLSKWRQIKTASGGPLLYPFLLCTFVYLYLLCWTRRE
jgi:hypothetical protein